MARTSQLLLASLLAGCASASSVDSRDLALPPTVTPMPDLATAQPPPPDLATVPDLAAPKPKAVLVTAADYAGLPSSLDGSKSSDPKGRTLTFTWHIAAPVGSAITDSSLGAAGGANKLSFVSDVGGTYTVTLTVSTPDGSNDTTTAMLEVPTAPIFYYEGTVTAGGQQIGVGVIRSDGKGRRALGCTLTVDAGAAADPYADFVETARFGLRTFNPARPAMPMGAAPKSRVAFLDDQHATFDSGTINEWRLWVGDEASSCATQPPVRVDDPASFNDHPHLYPRFSPDGTRVAYLDGNHVSDTQWRLVTVGLDGGNRHVVRGPTNTIHPAPPAWLDATHLAWVENANPNNSYTAPKLAVYAASDAEGAGNPGSGSPTTITYCYDEANQKPIFNQINQIEFVTGGMIIVGGPSVVYIGNPGTVGIYRISGGVCSTASKLAEEPLNGKAWDVALSPDGKTVAFSSTRGNLPDGATDASKDIWVVPADGSGAPTKLAGSPLFDDSGPRWIAGGKQLMWTQQDPDPDGGAYPRGGGIMVINADGTNSRSLIAQRGDAQSTTLVLGGSSAGHVGCSWSGFVSDGSGALGLGLLGAVLFIALARRHPRKP